MLKDKAISSPQIRMDIQALRGFAVTIVLLYHCGISAVGSGYLGVDVFFVISGFLITGMISRSIDSRTFSFREFYFRRAKRLLPAACATIALTTIAAPFFLPAPQLSELKQQVLGAITFSANIVLWKQTGYFDTAAATKPLLHFWSLAIEEQYYIILPLLLIFTTVRNRLALITTLSAASAIYCLLLSTDPNAKFYLLHTRAWELGIGSIAALIPRAYAEKVRPLYWPSLLVMICLPFFPAGNAPPDFWSAVICIATGFVILRSRQISSVAVRGVGLIGNASYSIYLIHWPIVVFVRAAYETERLPLNIAILTLTGAFIAGLLLYRLVERPIHRSAALAPKRLVPALAIATITVALLPHATRLFVNPAKDFTLIRSPNYGLSQVCDQNGPFKQSLECRTGDTPDTVIWGDSHAMHLAQAFSSSHRVIEQITRSACPPFIGIAPFITGNTVYTRDRADKCIQFNDAAIDRITKDPAIETVILASALSLFRTPSDLAMPQGQTSTGANVQLEFTRAYANTIARLKSAGKAVVFVESPPFSGFNVGECVEQRSANLIRAKSRSCDFNVAEYSRASAPEINLLTEMMAHAPLPVLHIPELLCSTGKCLTEIHGEPLYIDHGHLTKVGSRLIGETYNLPARIDAMMR